MANDLTYSLQKFEKALARLKEAYALAKNDVVRDSCAKRFEICVELAWKTIKLFLSETHGISVQSPKSCVREAYRLGIIRYESRWLDMMDWRNDLAHGYEESYAETVYSHLSEVIKLLNEPSEKLKNEI